MRVFLSVVLSTFLLSSNLYADTIVLGAAQDNTIYQDSTGNSNGSGDFFFTGQNGGASPRRGLIQFDLSTLPAGAVVTGVTLDLVASQVSSTTAYDISFHRLLAAWGESTSDANGGEGGGAAAAPGDATWNESFFGSQNWANPGGDFVTGASATTSVSTTGAYSWTGPGLVDDVQSWIDGTNSNFGWIGIGNEIDASSAKRFNSRNNASNNPTLTIEFDVIPEPATTGLIIFGCLGMMGRRRR